MRPKESPAPSPAPAGLAGWLIVLASTTSSSWPVAEPVWVAAPLALAGTALVAWQASTTSTTSTTSRQEAGR